MNLIDWILDNSVLIFSSIPTTILFIAYYKLNKRQKEAEVKQAEISVEQSKANVAQTKGDALTGIEEGYGKWVKHFNDMYDELKVDVDELKREGQKKDFIITDLKRKTNGLTKFANELKQSLSEVEKIACIKIECPIREPKLGEYKHKKEA